MSAVLPRQADTDAARDRSRPTRWVVRIGLTLAFALLSLGTLIEVASGAHADAVRYGQLLSDPSVGDRVLLLGVLALALTPVAQVTMLLVRWWRQRDYRYAAVAAAVIALLAVAAGTGIGR
jgi:uncharacterized membrane protein YqjE